VFVVRKVFHCARGKEGEQLVAAFSQALAPRLFRISASPIVSYRL